MTENIALWFMERAGDYYKQGNYSLCLAYLRQAASHIEAEATLK